MPQRLFGSSILNSRGGETAVSTTASMVPAGMNKISVSTSRTEAEVASPFNFRRIDENLRKLSGKPLAVEFAGAVPKDDSAPVRPVISFTRQTAAGWAATSGRWHRRSERC